MGTPLWSQDVSILWASGRIRQFFPTKDMTYTERVNAVVRFIILLTVCIYFYNRDTRYVLYGVVCIALLTIAAASGLKHGIANRQTCTKPTVNNPFANPLLTDYKDNPNKPPACFVDDVAQEMRDAYAATGVRDADDPEYRMAGFDRFYTIPDSSMYQAGREKFAAAVYGIGPTCKTDQSRCKGY